MLFFLMERTLRKAEVPVLGADAQLGWAGREEVLASPGMTGNRNSHLSAFFVSVSNSFTCLLFFPSKWGNDYIGSNLSPEYQSENKLGSSALTYKHTEAE